MFINYTGRRPFSQTSEMHILFLTQPSQRRVKELRTLQSWFSAICCLLKHRQFILHTVLLSTVGNSQSKQRVRTSNMFKLCQSCAMLQTPSCQTLRNWQTNRNQLLFPLLDHGEAFCPLSVRSRSRTPLRAAAARAETKASLLCPGSTT